MGNKELEGRIALVTGATRGIGRAAAVELGRSGAAIIGFGRSNRVAASELETILSRENIAHDIRLVDIADDLALEAHVSEAVDIVGPPTIVVAAAGHIDRTSLTESRHNSMVRMMDVHVWATVHCIQIALPFMISEGYGRVITVTSPSATTGTNTASIGSIDYACAKGAIIGLTRSAARELAQHNITVNCISPAARSEMFESLIASLPDQRREAYFERYPLGVPEIEDVAPAFAFLASPGASHVTGQIINVDGGLVI